MLSMGMYAEVGAAVYLDRNDKSLGLAWLVETNSIQRELVKP
jgi:diacylglycerol kinase family enzyme